MMMDPEKNERFSSFYLRRINRKMNWLMAIIAVTLIIKSASYIIPAMEWAIGLFMGGNAV